MLLVVLLSMPGTAPASPNLSLDDPAYEELARLRAVGRLSTSLGGFLPVTEAHARELLGGSEAHALDFWIAPVMRAGASASVVNDEPRPYSTPVHPRDLAGAISLPCEHVEGRPCGDGVNAWATLDSAAGYGDWVSAGLRVRLQRAAEGADTLVLDRAYLNAELYGVAAEVGRDAVAFGPSGRTMLSWSSHPAPIDHVRISSARPVALTDALRLSAQYLVGRSSAPQRYPGSLVTVSRVQLDVGDRLEVGSMQLLQLGGDGAPSLGVVDFIAEHVRRRDSTASQTDTSNRRFGGDVTLLIPELSAVRLYYEVMFEDIRRSHLLDAIRHDADHLVGVEVRLGADARHVLTAEWHTTGFRSYEHVPRTTGFTHAGLVVGAPLGPDAESIYASAAIHLDRFTLIPWLELARLSSDTYEYAAGGPIARIAIGEDEGRYRVGARTRVQLRGDIRLETEVMFEHVDDVGFEPGVTRNNAAMTASIIWYPRGSLGRLSWK